MKTLKIKLLIHSVILYLIGREMFRCKRTINNVVLPSLTDSSVIKASNRYQTLTKRWVKTEKKILLLRALILFDNNHNL